MVEKETVTRALLPGYTSVEREDEIYHGPTCTRTLTLHKRTHILVSLSLWGPALDFIQTLFFFLHSKVALSKLPFEILIIF